MRDGRTLHESTLTPVAARKGDGHVQVVPVAGRVTLGQATPPGSYTLKVTLAQTRGGRTLRTASQWIDFEVR